MRRMAKGDATRVTRDEGAGRRGVMYKGEKGRVSKRKKKEDALGGLSVAPGVRDQKGTVSPKMVDNPPRICEQEGVPYAPVKERSVSREQKEKRKSPTAHNLDPGGDMLRRRDKGGGESDADRAAQGDTMKGRQDEGDDETKWMTQQRGRRDTAMRTEWRDTAATDRAARQGDATKRATGRGVHPMMRSKRRRAVSCRRRSPRMEGGDIVLHCHIVTGKDVGLAL